MNRIDAAHSRADWGRVEQLYRQLSAIVRDETTPLPDVVAGALAESLGRLVAHYDGLEQEFMKDLFHIWSDIDQMGGPSTESFRSLYLDARLNRIPEYNPPGSERRRPKPFEASIETCRRLIDINHVRDTLSSHTVGGILGGSLSYGRFFNVCGAVTSKPSDKPSDTDLLLVLRDYEVLKDVPTALRSVEAIDRESLDFFERRVLQFPEIRRTRERCIFSHKLKLWEAGSDPHLGQYGLRGNYMLSVHVFSWSDFEFLIVKDKPVLAPGATDRFDRDLYDYRDTEPSRRDNLRAFSGLDYSMPLDFTPVALGYVNKVRVCQIRDARYYPSLHQNIILPQFEIRWELQSRQLYLPVLGFRWKLLERLQEERRIRPFEIQNLALSHTRYFVFSPHIVRRASRE